MRIAQVPTLASPVREHAFGSVESLVWLMTRELALLGHQVTVFGAAGSEVAGEFVETLPGPYGEQNSPDDWHLCEWINLSEAVRQSGRFDVLHSHAYLWGLPLEPLSQAPLVHTMHIVPEEDSARLWSKSPNACVTAISRQQWSTFPHLRPAAVIPHGVDPANFTLQTEPGDYVCYLGRIEAGKGVRHAISIARAAGVRLLIAGPTSPYFREQVQPLIDGKSAEYVGFVSSAERDQLLGGAKALLYPIQYPESFGLVLVEAMLCGTPVAAMCLGAVPEIVDDGITGFTAATLADLPEAMNKCFSLDRRRIRQHAETRFSVERMVKDYVRVYEEVIQRRNLA
jgi:glycosyltransferase involved in cell wall biosynthesis